MTAWPRLTETLTGPKEPGVCQSCGATHRVTTWREHGDKDEPEARFLCLCVGCADRLVQLHPRLYSGVAEHAPAPGAMALCGSCSVRVGLACPKARTNGGAGVTITASKPLVAFVDGVRNGRRWGAQMQVYAHPPTACDGREVRP